MCDRSGLPYFIWNYISKQIYQNICLTSALNMEVIYIFLFRYFKCKLLKKEENSVFNSEIKLLFWKESDRKRVASAVYARGLDGSPTLHASVPFSQQTGVKSVNIWRYRPGNAAEAPRVMSRVQLLRALVTERLSAAAEEIFEAVRKTIAGYEEEILLSRREIRRQRRMLQTVLQPEPRSSKQPGELIRSPRAAHLQTAQLTLPSVNGMKS